MNYKSTWKKNVSDKCSAWLKNLRTRNVSPIVLLAVLGGGIVLGGVLSPHKIEFFRYEESQSHENIPHATSQETIWTCSMHPQIRQHEPGLCPICGMDLIPIVTDGEQPGPKTVKMSERAKILSKIATTPVRRQQLGTTGLRLLGRIEQNETAVKNVTAWIGGRIDRLHVKATGQEVKRGQIVATLYSPEIFSAHQDLLVAKKQVEKMKESTEASKQAAKRTLEASRTRLSLLGVPEKVISNLEQQKTPTTKMAIRTPFRGTVTERVATEGAYVNTGALLYKVVNLSSVWIQLDAYESDLPALLVGQQASIQVEGLTSELFEGKITFIDPTLDPASRVARVRVEVQNQDGRLRPGMFVQAEVTSTLKDGALPPLVIPDTAPLFTGHRSIVFVQDKTAERPTYTARTVRLGVKTGNEYPIIAGLSEGEHVVTKGAFTLDADLQIRGGASMMTEPDDLQNPKADRILPITASEQKKLSPILHAYLEIQKQLAADDYDKAKSGAKELDQAAKTTKISGVRAVTDFWRTHRENIREYARQFSRTASIEEARGVFESLSNKIILLLERVGNPLDTPVRLTFCPMAFGSKGAHWVQSGETVDNPYYGNAMRTCGEIKKSIDAGTHLLPEMQRSSTSHAQHGGHDH